MTSSSSTVAVRGIDTMLIVYSLLARHPAAATCENYIRGGTGWLTTSLCVLEAKAILVKVYGVDAIYASQKLMQFMAGPIVVTPLDPTGLFASFQLADQFGIDHTDAVRLQAVMENQGTLLSKPSR